jgi:tetratricopeptide (TPR) repeat protein
MPDDTQPPIDSKSPLKHRAFFQAAGEHAEGSPEFRTLAAGLLVLRLIDRWLSQRTSGREVEFRELEAVQGRVESLADGPIRRVLLELLKTVGGAESFVRVPRLIVLGQLLESESLWEPAADVYLTATEQIQAQPRHRDLLPMCYDRQARCLRQVGLLDRAGELYNEGIAVAYELQDIRWSLYIRISNAILEGMYRGDLPEAEHQLRVIAKDAERANLPEMVARAVHERGQVAYARGPGQYLMAAQYFYTAASTHTEPDLIQRAELDLAVVLADLGFVDYAITICELIRSTPALPGSDQRTAAGINLIRLASLRGDRETFDRLRVELADERMIGRLLAHYHLTLGQGWLHFGEMDAARAALQRTIEVAEAHKVNQLIITAEKLLRTFDDERPKLVPRMPEQDKELAPILRAIDERQGPFAGTSYM